jgi:hypothetical protein
MRTAALVLAVVFLAGWCVVGSPLDGFLGVYAQGNIHAVFGLNPIEIIKLFGQEPDSYDYYSSDQRIFTYLDPNPAGGPSGLAFIWEDDEVKSIRVIASGSMSRELLLRQLGYEYTAFTTPVADNNRLGNVPYYTLTYTLPDVRPNWKGEMTVDVTFMFFINHLDNSVYMLIIE